MSQRIHPTHIGAFILVGVALSIGAVLVITGSRWFATSTPVILYFDSSLKGLNPGAPVKFRGVKIGEVRQAMIHYNQRDDDVHMPVLIDIHSDRVRRSMDVDFNLTDRQRAKTMIERGLRARLEAESLVTGQLYVELDVLANPPPAEYHQREQRYLEIPTAPTQIQQLLSNLASLDIPRLVDRVERVLVGLDRQLSDLQLGKISAGLTNVLLSVQRVVDTPQLTNAFASLNSGLSEISRLAANLNRQIDPLAQDAAGTLQSGGAAMDELRRAAIDLQDFLTGDGTFRRELVEALESLNEAARSLSGLAEQLNRHPNALIVGRRSRAE